MELHFTFLPKKTKIVKKLPYSIGDVVKIIKNGSCISDKYITKIFGLKDPKTINERWQFDNSYPNLENNVDEWKIIDAKHFRKGIIIILIKNRVGQYVVLCQHTSYDFCDYPIVKVVRKHFVKDNILGIELPELMYKYYL